MITSSLPSSFSSANPFLASQCLPNCAHLSFGHLADLLAQHCPQFRQQLDRGHRICAANAVELSASDGFTSRIFRCQFEFQTEDEEEKTKKYGVVAKVTSLERMETLMDNFVGKEGAEQLRRKMKEEAMKEEDKEQGPKVDPMFLHLHSNECNFYDFVGHPGPLPLPEVYYTQKGEGGEGLILMEDLSQVAHLESFARGLNRAQALLVIGHLAAFHAHLMAHPGWKAMFKSIPELFGADGPEDIATDWAEHIHKQLMDFDRDKFERPMKRLRRILVSMDFCKWATRKCEQELGIPEVLVHNDLWINNILWSNGREEEVAAFIDWQLCARGNPMTDLARLLAMNTSPELRHDLEHDEQALRHYLAELKQQLGQIGHNGELGYGIKELGQAYRLSLVGQALGCVFAVPFFQKALPREGAGAEEKVAKLLERAACALGDAIKILEQEAPEWLEDEDEDGRKTENGG